MASPCTESVFLHSDDVVGSTVLLLATTSSSSSVDTWLVVSLMGPEMLLNSRMLGGTNTSVRAEISAGTKQDRAVETHIFETGESSARIAAGNADKLLLRITLFRCNRRQ